MFNGILKSDDVEVYETHERSTTLMVSLAENCKSNIIVGLGTYAAYFDLPLTSYIGKIVAFTTIFAQTPNGKSTPNNNGFIAIRHSNTTLFTLKQGTVSFMYVGQQLNGLTATDKAKSGWIILGGVQGDTAITGYAGSVAIGSGAYCGGAEGITVGLSSTSSGNGVAIGSSASSTGAQAIAIGKSSNASSANGVAIGYLAYTLTASKVAFKSNTYFAANGDAQAGKFILMRQTTDATPLVMSATNAAASTSNILILPNNGTYGFTGQVVAKDATTLDSAMWEVTALMKRGANASTTALVGTPTVTKVFSDAGAAAWTIALTADTTNGGGAITVTGEAGKTIRWVSSIDSAEVI